MRGSPAQVPLTSLLETLRPTLTTAESWHNPEAHAPKYAGDDPVTPEALAGASELALGGRSRKHAIEKEPTECVSDLIGRGRSGLLVPLI